MGRIPFRTVSWLGLLGLIFTVMAVPTAVAQGRKGKAAEPAAKEAVTAKVDINNATEKQLEDLPGVGAATAKKIIAGRPYASVDDLAKAGVPKNTVAKITPLVTVGAAPVAAKPPSAAPVPKPAVPAATPAQATATPAKVDINNATEKQLEDLPGVGKATAGKIIAGRPYASVDELGKAGVPKNTIAKITPLVTVGPAPAVKTAPAAPVGTAKAAPTPVPTPMPAAPPTTATAKTAPAAEASYTPPPAAGMVWVNLDTKVYHKEGDRWYGKTKKGKYMTEDDAIKAGYRAVKEREKK